MKYEITTTKAAWNSEYTIPCFTKQMAFLKATHFQNIIYGYKLLFSFTCLFSLCFILSVVNYALCVCDAQGRDLDYPPWDVVYTFFFYKKPSKGLSSKSLLIFLTF